MRRKLFSIVMLVAVVCGGLLVAGCRIGKAVGESMPASEGYVDELHAAHDQAIADARRDADAAIAKAAGEATAALADLRTHVDDADAAGRRDADAAVAAVRADLTAAEAAQRQAYEQAIAAGRSQAEAIASGILEKLRVLGESSDRASGEAAAKAQQALDAAVAKAKAAEDDAVRRAGEALAAAEARATEARKAQETAIAEAKSKAGDSVPWWGQLLGLLGGAGGLGMLLKRFVLRSIDEYDAKPFRGPAGEEVHEQTLVASALSKPKA